MFNVQLCVIRINYSIIIQSSFSISLICFYFLSFFCFSSICSTVHTPETPIWSLTAVVLWKMSNFDMRYYSALDSPHKYHVALLQQQTKWKTIKINIFARVFSHSKLFVSSVTERNNIRNAQIIATAKIWITISDPLPIVYIPTPT